MNMLESAFGLTVKGWGFCWRLLYRGSSLLQRLYRASAAYRMWGYAVPLRTQFDGRVSGYCQGRMVFGPACRIGDAVHIEVNAGADLELGEHVRINRGCVITASTSVKIGSNALLGEYVSVRDANHGIDAAVLIRKQALVGAPVQIGQDVWIGRGACVLSGVSIGDGAVIAANAVVNRDVAAGQIVGGVPARILGQRNKRNFDGNPSIS